MNSVTDNAILEALTPYDRELIEWCVANLYRVPLIRTRVPIGANRWT
jgi:hypothetical protein